LVKLKKEGGAIRGKQAAKMWGSGGGKKPAEKLDRWRAMGVAEEGRGENTRKDKSPPGGGNPR